NRMVVAGANYVTAAVLALVMSESGRLDIGGRWITLGVVAGIGFVAGFILVMRAMSTIGLAVPTSAARLSMLIPVTGSILLFNERPSGLRITGIIIGIAAFILLGLAQRNRKYGGGKGGMGIIAAIFAIVGSTDLSMKVAQSNGVDKDATAFYIFTTAALLCWIVVAIRRIPVKRNAVILGLLLGIPNYFSVYYLLLALKQLDGSVVFPVVSAGGVIAVTATAAIFWKEYPNRTALIGLALATVAVALLGFQ
ncbi:MAG: EamA family transporter, partial [Bacteroidota bacterium]